MFCPNCGTEERQPSQYCRACGTDMRVVRTSLQRPDSVTAAAVSARDEIGKAIASKILELRTVKDLSHLAEDVLPEIEKFLESPEERRLRRIRIGITVASVGFGVVVFMLLLSSVMGDRIPWPVGFVPLFIGLGILINGWFFTTTPPPRRQEQEFQVDADKQRQLESGARFSTSELQLPSGASQMIVPPSVTEHTTEMLPPQAREAIPRARNTN
ncbi:MAG: zinc ribbon domain-containing protein [Acidobacteria bacterium]|nr:zinc ribbon domain-containing protein [Acidobacteriota bacterium]